MQTLGQFTFKAFRPNGVTRELLHWQVTVEYDVKEASGVETSPSAQVQSSLRTRQLVPATRPGAWAEDVRTRMRCSVFPRRPVCLVLHFKQKPCLKNHPSSATMHVALRGLLPSRTRRTGGNGEPAAAAHLAPGDEGRRRDHRCCLRPRRKSLCAASP